MSKRLTTKDVAQRFGVSERDVDRIIERGDLPEDRSGIPADAVDEMAARPCAARPEELQAKGDAA